VRAGLGGCIAALVALTGCSFLMNVAPSDPARRTTQAAHECTGSYLAPGFDTVSAGVGVYNTAVAAGSDEVSIYGIHMKREVALPLSVAQLVVFAASVTYGYIQASRCNALRSERHLDAAAGTKTTDAGNEDEPNNDGATATATATHEAETHGMPTMPVNTHDSVTIDLPSWSAFRREPLGPTPDPPEPPHSAVPKAP
jgi:hypothetical protein